jgi:hypothetical protein
MQKNHYGNLKGFYRAAIHLGFIEKSEEFIKEVTEVHHQNLLDYFNLKSLIEKKVQCMKKWRKPVATAKKGLKNLEQILTKSIKLI